MIEVVDAIDRQVVLERPARRVVSLVPSETWSVEELAGLDRLVARTDFCIEPSARIESIPSVGGTKGFDVDAVRALRPDLVLANKEENSRPQVEAMIDAGLPVHVSFPCTVAESVSYLESLCVLLGIDPDTAPAYQACRAAVEQMSSIEGPAVPVFVPIWKAPWMTFDDGAYASDVLRICGATNVFGSRARRYPLAADLGKREPLARERVGNRDTRYPRIRLGEVVELGAQVALLPDEPHAFTEADAEELRGLREDGSLDAELVDGKDLFWYGTHVARALPRLRRTLDGFRASGVRRTAHN